MPIKRLIANSFGIFVFLFTTCLVLSRVVFAKYWHFDHIQKFILLFVNIQLDDKMALNAHCHTQMEIIIKMYVKKQLILLKHT